MFRLNINDASNPNMVVDEPLPFTLTAGCHLRQCPDRGFSNATKPRFVVMDQAWNPCLRQCPANEQRPILALEAKARKPPAFHLCPAEAGNEEHSGPGALTETLKGSGVFGLLFARLMTSETLSSSIMGLQFNTEPPQRSLTRITGHISRGCAPPKP